jgi:DNA-binding transcriptional LysR family regulator
VFLRYAQQVLDTLTEAETACQRAAQRPEPLKICDFDVGSDYYPALMPLRQKHEFTFVKRKFSTPFFKELEAGSFDIGLNFDLSPVPGIPGAERYADTCSVPIGQRRMGVCMMATNPLAVKRRLTRQDLIGVTVVINDSAYYDDFRYLVLRYMGNDLGLRFRLDPTWSVSTLSLIDLDGDIYVCALDIIDSALAKRNDIKVYRELDSEELLFTDCLVFVAHNQPAAELARDLQQATKYGLPRKL